jgi:hypothetical protein
MQSYVGGILLRLSDISPHSIDSEALVPSEEEVDVQLVGLRAGSERAGQQEGLQAYFRYVRVLAQDVTHGPLPVHASKTSDGRDKMCGMLWDISECCLLKKDFSMKQYFKVRTYPFN